MVRAILAGLVKVLIAARPYLTKGVARVFLFWKGGIAQYIGMTIVVVLDNEEAFRELVLTLNPVPLIHSIGENLIYSVDRVLDGILTVGQADGAVPVTLLGYEIGLPPSIAAIGLILVPLVTMGWYFRTIHTILTMKYGDMFPWNLSLWVGMVIFPLMMLASSAEFPVEKGKQVLSMLANQQTG